MRDRRFVAKHRGGPLEKDDHRKLAAWSAACAAHVISCYWKNPKDQRPAQAIEVALAWSRGEVPVGQAQKAAVAAHAAARAAKNPAAVAVARAAGHAVATAHMAEHCLGGAGYALRAVLAAGENVAQEKTWQNRRLPRSVRALVLSARKTRGVDPKANTPPGVPRRATQEGNV